MSYPDDNNLTSPATLKTYLDPNVPGTTSDALLTALITSASALLIQSTNLQAFYVSAVDATEKRNGNGAQQIMTRLAPIVSITSLTIGTTVIPLSDGTSAGYLFDDQSIYLIGYCFTRGVQNVSIVYKGGYAAGSGVANMMEHACLITCALWWKRRAHIDQSSMSSPSGIGTISYTQKDLPAEAMTITKQIASVVVMP